ncbi:MAG: hypothetical protein HYY40_13960 [Bacteroidetes bacterium]|nr:hypothetical protein [Bacteroidota bacterium]
MTIDSAIEILKGRMDDLGYRKSHYMQIKHFVLHPGELREVNAYNQLWILADESADVNVAGEMGVYDLSLKNVNELKYEFQGSIKIKNNAPGITRLRFVAGIPKHKKRMP